MPNSRQEDPRPVPAATATVSSEYLRLFAIGAEARGLDLKPILAASGIDRAILGRRRARVGWAAAAEAWKRATKRVGDQHFGLTLAEELPFGAANLIDYLVLSSANVGDGLSRVIRYFSLMSDAERLTMTVHGNEAHFRFHSGHRFPYSMEMNLGLFARRARDLFGASWSLKRICFQHAALGPRATYDRICQAPVCFEMPFTEAVFARDLTELPMPGADARLSAILAAEADVALAALTSPPSGSFIDTVKRVLEGGLHERDLTLTRLADRLGISTRTLQRRLRAAGVTHRGLVRGVRQDVATRSLATRVSQGQIARNLGYSGPGAFQRAFKSWSGMTPGQLRRNPAGLR
jgi:AraC-like DNA-binding protein